MTDPLEVAERGERICQALEDACDLLPELREMQANATAEANRLYNTAMLEAATVGHGKNREERTAYAELEAVDAQAVATICERAYWDQLTYIKVLQSQLELVKTTMVTLREIRV